MLVVSQSFMFVCFHSVKAGKKKLAIIKLVAMLQHYDITFSTVNLY